MDSLFSGSAVVAATLFASSLVLSTSPLVSEPPFSPLQQQRQEPTQTAKSEPRGSTGLSEAKMAGDTPTVASSSGMMSGVVTEASDPAGGFTTGANSSLPPLTSSVTYMATAYSLSGRTASGKRVAKGLIAADPTVLPLGTWVRLEAGSYSGEYLVADTGGAVRGKRIDIWTPTTHEATRFGRRAVKLTVLRYGVKRKSLRRHRSR